MKIFTSEFIVFILHFENVAMGCKKTPEPPPKSRCKLPLVSRQVKEAGGSLICSGHADPYYNVPKKHEDIAAQLLAKGGVIENGMLVIEEELIVQRKYPETSECHVICPPGFIPAPNSSTSCSAGVWTQDPATMLCAPSPCGVPTAPQYGKYSCFGNPSTCYLTCEPGYATMSNTTINCQDGSWDVDPRSILCEVAVALLIGGYDGAAPFYPETCQTAEVFSPEDEACSSVVLPPLLIGVNDHTSHLLNGEILLCGGNDCGRIIEKIITEQTNKTMYNETESVQSCFKMLDSNTWSLHSVLPEYRTHHMGVIQQNKLQLIAEDGPTLVLQENNWKHDRKPSLPLTAYPSQLARPCSVVTSPITFIVIGGSVNLLSDKNMGSVLEFNSLTGEWRALPDIPVGRYEHACALVTTKSGPGIMVVGGSNFKIKKRYPLESAFLLDLGTEIWYPAGNLNLGRESMGLVALGEKIMVLGSSYFSKEGGTIKEEAVEEYAVPCPSLRECSPSQQGTWNITGHIIKRRSALSVLPVAASRFNCTR